MLTQDLRPFKFDDMIGHKAMMSEMRTRSKTKDFPGVMIFAGESGTGKTTLALIIAAILNDPNPIIEEDGSLSPNPESPTCQAILNEKFHRDVNMYDASSMGKDDIKAIERLLSTRPMKDPKRVIIIDEAQELSKQGKGAVLKLLEKKRDDAYIILCTMNLDAFGDEQTRKAIKSRGATYLFRKLKSEDIAEYLFEQSENIKDIEIPEEFFEKGIFTIAENSEGSLRQAIQVFERCIYGQFFSEEAIINEFGFVSQSQLNRILVQMFKVKNFDMIAEAKRIDFQTFFRKTFKMITDAHMFQKTGKVDASWKKATAVALEKTDLRPFIEAYLKADSGPYLKQSVFWYYIVEAMSQNPSTKQLAESSVVPTRRAKRTPV